MYTIAADGSGPPQIVLKGARMVPNDWSLDGHLVFMDFAKGPPRLAMYSAGDHSVAPLGGESEAQFSPDANWIAYSGPRGRLSGEIFVQPVRGPSRRFQISNAGGGSPAGAHDGKRIFYLAPDKKLMTVTFDPQNMTATALGFRRRYLARRTETVSLISIVITCSPPSSAVHGRESPVSSAAPDIAAAHS